MATAPQGLARLAAYAQLLRGTPLVAIGGIGAEQFAAVRATGVGQHCRGAGAGERPRPRGRCHFAQGTVQYIPLIYCNKSDTIGQIVNVL